VVVSVCRARMRSRRRSCVENADAVLSAGWFHWHLSSAEVSVCARICPCVRSHYRGQAARLLAAQPRGTFLIRFSKSKVGNFAIAVQSDSGNESVRHARIERNGARRFVLDGETVHA
jgi:hypothetical protein